MLIWRKKTTENLLDPKFVYNKYIIIFLDLLKLAESQSIMTDKTCSVRWKPVTYVDRVHSQPGNQGNQGIAREFENGPFFTEKSGKYQGILIEHQGNQGKNS